jgi:hypothetical protein
MKRTKDMAAKLLRLPAADIAELADSDSLTPASFGLDGIHLSDRYVQIGLLFANPASATFQNLLGSIGAVMANSPEGTQKSTCYRLSKHKQFQAWLAALKTFYAKLHNLDQESILLDLAEVQARARLKGDVAVLTRLVELKAKLGGALDGGFVTEDENQVRQLSHEQQQEAMRIASLRLKEA